MQGKEFAPCQSFSREIEIPRELGPAITGEEIFYFAVHAVDNSEYDQHNDRDIPFFIPEVNEGYGIWMESAYDMVSAYAQGRITSLERLDEKLGGQEYRELVRFLNAKLANDACFAIYCLPDSPYFEPHYMPEGWRPNSSSDLAVTVHDAQVGGVKITLHDGMAAAA